MGRMGKPSWKTFFDVLAFVIVFAVPVILYLMEKAGVALRAIFFLGWASIAVGAVYISLNIPWVWADVALPFRIWRVCLVSSLSLLAVGYGAINIWPKAEETTNQKASDTSKPLGQSPIQQAPSSEPQKANRIEHKSAGPAKQSPVIQQFAAAYGNLSNRCRDLGQAIVDAADERKKTCRRSLPLFSRAN